MIISDTPLSPHCGWFLRSWNYFDFGPVLAWKMDRIIILTTDFFLCFFCEAVRLCGDGTFKAVSTGAKKDRG